MRNIAISFTILGAIAMSAATTQPAELPEPEEPVPGCCSCCAHRSGECCGCCREVCFPKTEEVKEEKSCRKVDCEKICVPAIRLPWEPGGSPLTLFNCLRDFGRTTHAHCRCAGCGMDADCCESCSSCDQCCHSACVRCGTVKCVNKLGEETYEETKCATTWEIKCIAVPCAKCGHARCSCIDTATSAMP